MTLIPALKRQTQADPCKFEAILVYIVSYRKAELTNETVSNTKKLKYCKQWHLK